MVVINNVIKAFGLLGGTHNQKINLKRKMVDMSMSEQDEIAKAINDVIATGALVATEINNIGNAQEKSDAHEEALMLNYIGETSLPDPTFENARAAFFIKLDLTGHGMSALIDYKLIQNTATRNPQNIIIEKGDSYDLLVKALHLGDVSNDSKKCMHGTKRPDQI